MWNKTLTDFKNTRYKYLPVFQYNIQLFSLPKTTVKLRPRTAQEADKNLNLINNNKSREEDSEEKDMKLSKRRSYHPQDFLSKVFIVLNIGMFETEHGNYSLNVSLLFSQQYSYYLTSSGGKNTSIEKNNVYTPTSLSIL